VICLHAASAIVLPAAVDRASRIFKADVMPADKQDSRSMEPRQQRISNHMRAATGPVENVSLWTILLLAAFVAFAFQGSRHLWDPDEGRYTNVAHEMLTLDDWLVPRLHPERPHYTKPPMTYWAIAASFAVFGNNEWAARLPNAIAFVLTGLLALGIARRLGLISPALAACCWITMWGPVAAANVVTTDTLLAMFETLAVFGFVASGIVEPGAEPRRKGIRLMWLGFGLAFLTKGPPGLLPLAAIVVFVLWRRRSLLRALFDPLGLALFVPVGLGWYGLVIRHSPDLLDYFLYHETIGRVATGAHHRNAGWSGWLTVYPVTLVFGSLPWIIVATLGWWSQRKVAKVAGENAADQRRFLFLWIALPLTVFSIAQSRLPLYVLPLFVPLALLLAPAVASLIGTRRGIGIAVTLAALVAVGIKAGGAHVSSERDDFVLAAELRNSADFSDIEEIVFIDVPARYGLRHYLGINVEEATSTPTIREKDGYSPPEPVCAELASPEHKLWLGRTKRLGEIETSFAQCKHRLENIGTVRKWTLLRSLPAEEPDAPGSG